VAVVVRLGGPALLRCCLPHSVAWCVGVTDVVTVGVPDSPMSRCVGWRIVQFSPSDTDVRVAMWVVDPSGAERLLGWPATVWHRLVPVVVPARVPLTFKRA